MATPKPPVHYRYIVRWGGTMLINGSPVVRSVVDGNIYEETPSGMIRLTETTWAVPTPGTTITREEASNVD